MAYCKVWNNQQCRDKHYQSNLIGNQGLLKEQKTCGITIPLQCITDGLRVAPSRRIKSSHLSRSAKHTFTRKERAGNSVSEL